MQLENGRRTSADWRDDGLDRIGLFGSYLFAFFAGIGISIATAALVLLVLAFLLRFRDWRSLVRDPLAILCVLFALYAGLHSLAFALGAPTNDLARDILDTGANWAKLVLLIPFAFWAAGDPVRVRRLLLLALLGFVLGALRKIDWAAFDAAFFHTRFENYLPANAFGMFSALGALGLIGLREAFWSKGGALPRWPRILAWLLLLAMTLQGLFLSYSRGAWLAFVIAALLLVYLEWRARPPRREQHRNTGMAVAASGALALAAVATFLVSQADRITDRLLYEQEVATQILRGDWDEVAPSSIGLRVHAARFASQLLGERPLFGYGAGSSRSLIAGSDKPELMVNETNAMSHLHNTYTEVLIQLGIVGFILVAAIVGVLARDTVRECRAGSLPGALCRFLLVALVFVLIWNLFDYRAVRHDWRFFWIIIAGCAYSFHLRSLRIGTAAHSATLRTRAP